MNEVVISKYDEIVMKLLHFFITEQGYSPIILHGAKNEIWLENLKQPHQVIRIVTNYIHNDEQMNFDIYKTKQIVNKIKKQTFSLGIKTISIFLNLGDNVNFSKTKDIKNIVCINPETIDDIYKNDVVKEEFPTFNKTLNYQEEGFELLMKISADINKNNELENKKAEEIFKTKTPVITYMLISINIILFVMMYLFGNGSTDNMTLLKFGANYGPLVLIGEYWRLITAGFLHIGFIHLFMNMAMLYILGAELENFLGKFKYLSVYMVSLITGSLLSLVLSGKYISAGASGAIFGIMGSLLYFGYHYRAYLGIIMKRQILPLLIINIINSFTPGVDLGAHFGGLIGGVLMTMAVGVKYKTNRAERINGTILLTIFTVFLIYLGFFK